MTPPRFPTVLAAMSEKLEVTTKIGDAFLAQPKEVMATIQELHAAHLVAPSSFVVRQYGHCMVRLRRVRRRAVAAARVRRHAHAHPRAPRL